MDADKLKREILSAVREFLEASEAWEDAQITIDTLTGNVSLAEEEETESLPDSTDVYDIMDFVEMTPGGKWIPDVANIDQAAEDYDS